MRVRLLAALFLLGGTALAAGRPELKVYFQSNLTDAAYQKKTFERVAAKWRTPQSADVPAVGRKAVVQGVIARDGTLVSAVMSLTSGKESWDKAALKAVKSSSPFDPLPASFRPPSVEVHFHVGVVP